MVPTTARTQEAPSASDKEIISLVKDMLRAPNVDEWFAQNKQRVTPEIAAAADKLASRALAGGDLETARYVSLFAALDYLRLGDRGKALKSFLDQSQAQFGAAEKFEEYEALRKSVLDLRTKAESISRADLAFSAQALAAECSFFAAETKKGPDAEGPLLDTLGDAAAALAYAKSAANRGLLERFVDLLAATIDKTMNTYSAERDQAKIDSIYKQIAASAELAIPADFAFTLFQENNTTKSIAAARALAAVSYGYGNARSASARLALAADRAKQSGDIDLWESIIAERYRGDRAAGLPTEHVRQLRDAARRGEQTLRAMYRSRAGRIWAAYRSDNLFGEMLRDELGEPSSQSADIFAAVEALKARTLLDAMYFPAVSKPPGAQSAVLERQVLGFSKDEEENRDLMMSEMKLVSQLAFSEETFHEIFEGRVSERVKALLQLEEMNNKMGTGYRQSEAPTRLDEVQRALQPREAILEYVIPYHRTHPAMGLWILFITRTAFQTAHVPLNNVLRPTSGMIGRLNIDGKAPLEASPLGELVVYLRKQIQIGDEENARGNLRSLHRLLIQPLLDQGVRWEDYDRVIIVPHLMLHYVPFAALLDDKGSYLISKTALTVAPSASVWFLLNQRSGSLRHFVGFGNPDLRSRGTVELKYAAQEMADIPKLLLATNPIVFVGPDATEDRFAQEAPSANILHISTHGDFPDEDAIDLHAILLAKGKAGDGAVRAARVCTLKLSSARLVALSVCNGGLYRIGPADEPYGLVPAFLEAGAQNVLGTLWKLDDEFGKDFMEEFYRHVMQDGPAEAYRKACLHFLKADEDLRNWAGFVLVGPGRPFLSESN